MKKKQGTSPGILRELAAQHRARAAAIDADADRIEIRQLWRELKPLLRSVWQLGIESNRCAHRQTRDVINAAIEALAFDGKGAGESRQCSSGQVIRRPRSK